MRRKNFIDMSGKKIGMLTVIKEVPSRLKGKNKFRARFLCQCECGTLKEVDGANLRAGDTISCGCYRKLIRKQVMREYHARKNPYSVENRYYNGYKSDTKRNNRKFNISFKKFMEMIQLKCHYCGSKPNLKIFNKGKSRFKIVNGIDRINSNKGYLINNIITCCSKCNLMKNVFSVNDFLSHVDKIYKYSKLGLVNINN